MTENSIGVITDALNNTQKALAAIRCIPDNILNDPKIDEDVKDIYNKLSNILIRLDYELKIIS